MSNHLKVELRKLKRSLDGGYGFDLTRFCAGCWNRLGRVLRRGLCCESCGKRVCKTCRHFLDEKTWICVLCYKKKFSGEAWWHDDANVQRFKGSQGKSGTYLLRLTDWSSHGVLDYLTANDTLGRRIHSFSEESFFATSFEDPAALRNLKYKLSINTEPQSHPNTQLTSQLGWNWNQKWRLLSRKNNDENKEQNSDLQYTSTTLKNKRKEVRELSRMSQNHELSHEVHKSSRRRRHLSRKQKSSPNVDPNASDLKVAENDHSNNDTRLRKPVDYDNFLPDVNRKDSHARMSVRGTRVFGRKKRYRPYLEGHMFEAIPDLKCKSFSLPSELHTAECHQDDEFWSTGFVQSRVRRLEEDLNSSKWHDRYNYDFEVQSLCSLELGRILPDSDDYRIAYLSSVGTSLESSLDYMEDSISAFGTGSIDYRQLDCSAGGMGTLDVRLRKKEMMEEIHEDEWDMSLNSCEENEGFFSSSEDEFQFVKVGVTSDEQIYQCANSQKSIDWKEKSGNIVVDKKDKKMANDCTSNEFNRYVDERIKTEMFEPVEVNKLSDSTETHQRDSSENVNINDIENNAQKTNHSVIDLKSSCTDSEMCFNFETQKEDDVDCKEDCDSKNNSEIQSTKDEANHPILNTLNPVINSTNPINFPETKMTKKIISNEVIELQNCTNKNMKNINFYAAQPFNERLMKRKNFIKGSKFINKKNNWLHKTYSVSYEPFDKLSEMYDYEPLSTPFAEIYAISCNVPLSFQDDQSKIELGNVYSRNNLLNDEIFFGGYSDTKLNFYTPRKISNNSIKFIFKRVRLNVNSLLYLPLKIYEVSTETKSLFSNLFEIYKIDIYRTLTNEISCLPLVGTSIECVPHFRKKHFDEDCHDTHYNFNLKIFYPKHYPFYVFDAKNFLQNFKAKSNEACLHYIEKCYDLQIQCLNRHRVIQEFEHAPSNLFGHRNVKFLVDSHDQKEISQIAIPLEKLPFHEENYFNNYTNTPISKFYNFYLSKRCIIPVLHLLQQDNACGRNKLQPNSHLHKLMKLHPLNKPHLRKRNYLIRSDLCHNETKLVASETPSESRFIQQLPTSPTCQATCAESPCFQSQNACECSEARLVSGFVTVPAVERVAERESCCSCSVRPRTADGADRETTAENQNTQISCTATRNGSVVCCRSLILDYAETDTLDYRRKNGDYCFTKFGYPAKSSATLLIVATSDSVNSSNGIRCCSTELPRDMATCDAEQPRSLGKHVRAQGKNISKLMRLFDSNDRSNSVRKTEDCRTKIGVAQQSQCVMDNQRPNDISEVSFQNSTAVEAHVKVLDNSSPSSFVTDGSLNVSNKGNSDKSPSDIPYCRKVPNGGGLWENVNIGSTNGNDGLWNTLQNHNHSQESSQVPNSSASSTTELNNLIAVSKAELSKLQESSPSDKSNLENYFTSFESYKSEESSATNNNAVEFHNNAFHPAYDCDMNEMSFEDEEAMMSDTSSDEDLRPHPAMANTNYLPAYALHTIIEESCEESERDSRTTTPTNDANTSKLERYFSWDIINDAEVNQRKKSDDQSTVYSDSLSESSGSLIADEVKDIDPSHLASSRLEKYFTSGLVDDQNYFYPEDAEFLDDAPVSDFEEDSIHQKISRSALLSSLETMPTSNDTCDPVVFGEIKESESNLESKYEESKIGESPLSEILVAKLEDNCDIVDESAESIPQSESSQSLLNNIDGKYSSKVENIVLENSESCSIAKSADVPSPVSSSSNCEIVINPQVLAVEIEISENVHNEASLDNAIDKSTESIPQKPVVNKDQLAIDIQAIIKKLLSYFTSETSAESFKDNIETDYISAWQILETEIERLLQSISPNGLENNSCSSSTIDSNNSDYGSDTIESMDCMTDEDDNMDAKSRLNTKCPLVDMLSSSYKIQAEPDLSSFNISDETLNIWKRLILSLQRDNSVLSENKVCDPTAEARLYIRDQIVTLMHTVTVNDSLPEIVKPVDMFQCKDVLHSLEKDNEFPVEINEAINVNLSHSDTSVCKANLDKVSKTCKEELSLNDDVSSDHPEVNHPSSVLIVKQNDSICDINTNINCESASDDVVSCKMLCNSNSNTENLDSSIPDQVDTKSTAVSPKPQNKSVLNREANKESSLKFSVVNIELDEGNCSAIEPDQPVCKTDQIPAPSEDAPTPTNTLQSSLPESTEIFSVPFPFGGIDESQASTSTPHKSSRDTGYYSFKSSDDSLLNTSSASAELVDVPNFKSLKRSIKKFPLSSSTLSKSSSNILQAFSAADAKFSTLQLKPKKSKSTQGASSSTSPKFSSLFSPSSVLKRLSGSKSNETSNNESSVPPKYLKKYARSASVDNESLFGAVSMPVLSTPRPGDSYSALGLYSENDRDSSLTLDDEAEAKRYFSGSQSVLSLGAHSASMTSVYSAAGCHYGYVTVTGDVLFGLNYNQKAQMMEVFVKQCRNLAAMDVRHNKSNPYVKVYLLPDKTRSGKRKTKTKKNTVNPVFNELLRFPVLKNELESRTLWLSVWNSDLFGRNDFLGEISLPLGYRLLDSPTLRWYPLQERVESLSSPLSYRGEVFLALKYVPRDLSLESRFRPAPVISLRGALHVLIKEARNIATNRKTLDAFCKSYLLPDKSKCTKQKTPVVRRSNHPKWYYTVIYEDLSLDELREERSLELTLWDHDAITTNRFMGGVRLNAGSGLYHGLSVDWMDARRDESSLWHAMLDSPNMWVDGCLPLRPTMHFHNS